MKIYEDYCESSFDSLDNNIAKDYIEMFLYGSCGKIVDLDKAKSLCQRALSSGIDVNYLMEIIFEKRGESTEHFNFLLEKYHEHYYSLDSEKNIYYTYKVFHCYFDGYGTNKDYTKAKKVLEKAPYYYLKKQNEYTHKYEYEAFSKTTQEQLLELFFYAGQYREYGWADTPIDYVIAKDCYGRCSFDGIYQASLRLGELYLYGKGCKPNYDAALRLFRKAEDHGLNVQRQIQLAQKAIKKSRLHRVFKFLFDPQKYIDSHKT